MLKTFVTEFPDTSAGHAGVTVMEALVGMGISFCCRYPDRNCDGCNARLVRRCIYPILVVTQTVPVIVLAPIFIIYMGFGYAPKILTVVLMCFFPIVVSFCDGLRRDGSGLPESGEDLWRFSKWQIYRIVKIPAAMISLSIRSEGRGHLQHQRSSRRRMDRVTEWSWLLSHPCKKWLYAGQGICLRADDCHFEPVDERGSEAVRVCSAAITQEAQKTNMTSGRVFIA